MSEKPVSSKTLLVIDDDPSVLQLIKLLMEPLVSQIWTSLDPSEGLRLAIMHRPSLILLDNHMEQMLGVQVLEKLRKIPSSADIPVIMMTADSSIETVRRAASQHVQGYLLKPCDPDVLLEKVAPWLDLALERPRRELSAPLHLSPEQEHRLDMQGLQHVLSLLSHELNLLAVGARNPEILAQPLQQLQSFRQALSQPPPRLDIFGQFGRFESSLFAQLALFWPEYPQLAQAQKTASEANLRALCQILRERSQQFMQRFSEPLAWKSLPIAQLRADLAFPPEAAGNNSLAHYQTDYQHLEKLMTDYAVTVELRGIEPDQIYLPVLLPDLLRDLAGQAYHQTPAGGAIGLRLIQDRQRLSLTVSDSGPGLSLEQLIAQAEAPEQPALLKAARLAHRLGGQSWLSSRPGAGLDLGLELPIPQPAESA